MKRQNNKDTGTLLCIPLDNRTFGYGRVLESPYFAFYDYSTSQPETDLDLILSKPVLFRTAVRRRPDQDKWEAIGHRDLDPELARPVRQFTQDRANPARCTISDSAGHARPATPEECIGIERDAVWDTNNIESRLLNYFLGRPDEQTERLKVRLK